MLHLNRLYIYLKMKSVHTFSELTQITKPDVPILLDFYAHWCGPCKAMAPFFEQLSTKYTSVVFAKVNVDEAEELSNFFSVTALPTFILLKNGKEIKRFSGSSRQRLEEMLKIES